MEATLLTHFRLSFPLCYSIPGIFIIKILIKGKIFPIVHGHVLSKCLFRIWFRHCINYGMEFFFMISTCATDVNLMHFHISQNILMKTLKKNKRNNQTQTPVYSKHKS
jgi:hypothetical protein